MNSKEALEILFSSYNFDGNYHDLIIAREKLEQSLDRLEQLEKENQGVKDDNTRLWHGLEYANNENAKLKKALEKACEKLDYTCPLEEELVDDLDCGNCENNCKECWKKFFLKEVLGNE